MTSIAARTARPSAPLTATWLITALVCGPVGFLLFALSERSGDRLLGAVLTGAAVLAGVTAAAVFATGDAARALAEIDLALQLDPTRPEFRELRSRITGAGQE